MFCGKVRKPGLVKSESIFRSAASAVHTTLIHSSLLRYFRNRRRFPGLALAPDVNCAIKGQLSYGHDVGIGEGCNLIVPKNAKIVLGDGCYIGRYVELGPAGSIEIGAHVSIQDRSILVGDIAIGRYCMLSLNVLMASGTHYFALRPHLLIRDQDLLVSEDATLSAQHSRQISVGEDCWLGVNSVVMPGVTIGRGCVIGANTVVTKDIAPYSVAVGSPARVVKSRLDFLPPRNIDLQDEAHISYFYSGFALSQSERQRNKPLGGHIANGHFAVYLASDSPELRLRARSVSNEPVVLSCGETTVHLSNDWHECRFPADTIGATWFDASAPIVVSNVWLV
jgi:acetyltransferase-like isoleucine patch superfamily enzyme